MNLWKAASVGQVWLTAVMTLVAGFPQVECRCPRETVKPRASGTAASAPRCCCGGVACCCSSTGNGVCCHARVAVPAKHSPDRVVVSRHAQVPAVHAQLLLPQCVKGLAQPEAFVSAPAKNTSGADTPLGKCLPAPPLPVAVVLSPVYGMRACADPPLCSPPDLITLHQHFII